MNTIKFKTALLASALTMGVGFSSVVAASDIGNSVRAGVMINPIGTVGMVEYERLLSDSFGMGVRAGIVDYDYDDDNYHETGDGNGFEIIASFYPSGEGFKGFYLSGGIGFWNTSWAWTETYSWYTYVGSGESEAIDVNLSVGWKIPMGTPHAYFQPSLVLGNFFSETTKTTSSTHESELGFYAGLGLTFGAAF